MKKTNGLIAAAAACGLVLIGVLPAHAAETAYLGSATCSSGRVVVTTSKSTAGWINHTQTRNGTAWVKDWVNTTTTSRTYSKAFPSVDAAKAVAEVTLNSASVSCVA